MILADLHTHTRFSDGKDKFVDMVIAAREKGLKQIGNAEHGLRHIAFGLERSEIVALTREIDICRNKYPDIQILMGIEANLYSSYGDVDLKGSDYALFDYVAFGYHHAAFPKNIHDAFRYNFASVFRKNYTQAQINRYTNSYIKAITAGKVQFVVHPCYGLPVNVREISKAARDYGVFVELNGKRVSMSDEEVLTIVDEGATLIVNSDAHSASRVGDFAVPLSVVERLNIDKKKIVNWAQTVVFNKKTAYNE